MCFPLMSNGYLVTVKTNLQVLTMLGKGGAAQLCTAAFTGQSGMQLSKHFVSNIAFLGTQFIKSCCGIISPLNDKFYTKFQLNKFQLSN